MPVYIGLRTRTFHLQMLVEPCQILALLLPWHPNLIKAGDFMCDCSSWHSDDTRLRTSSRRKRRSPAHTTMFLSALKNRSAWKQRTVRGVHWLVDGVQISLNCTKVIRKTKQSVEPDKTRRRGAGWAGGRKQFGQKTFLRGVEGAGGEAAAA